MSFELSSLPAVNQGDTEAAGSAAADTEAADSTAKRPTRRSILASRIYSGFICAAAFSLGLTTILSCASTRTADVHLLSVRTSPLQDLSTQTAPSEEPYCLSGYCFVRNMEAKRSNGSPDEYLFGISGICRIWDGPNAVVECDRNIFHESDALALIRLDLSEAQGNSLYDTSKEQLQWNIMAKTSSVLLIFVTIFTFVLTCFIQLNVLPSKALEALMILNAFFTFAAASLWTAMAIYQAHSYSISLAPISSDTTHPVAFGPGFYTLWIFFLCSLALTPRMVTLTGFFLFYALGFILGIVLLVAVFGICVAGAAGGGQGRQSDDWPRRWNLYHEEEQRRSRRLHEQERNRRFREEEEERERRRRRNS